MKQSTLQKLIREEVKKATSESTMLMRSPLVKSKVETIINMLKEVEVDGETMQYILKEVGMEEQMQHQLTPGGIR